jgi:hypothetical protein
LCTLLLEDEWIAHQTIIWSHNVSKKYRQCQDLSLSVEGNDAEKDRMINELRMTKRHHPHSIHELNFVPKP